MEGAAHSPPDFQPPGEIKINLDATERAQFKATQTTPINHQKIEESYHRCTKDLAQAAQAEYFFLSGNKAGHNVVKNARDALDKAIHEETENLEAFNQLNEKDQREPKFQVFFRELPAKILEMEIRRAQLNELIEGENSQHLKILIDTKKEINGLLDEARDKPELAGERICQAQDAFETLRLSIPENSPLSSEMDRMAMRIDTRANALKLTEEQHKAIALITSPEPPKKTGIASLWTSDSKVGKEYIRSAKLAQPALFTLMAQYRTSRSSPSGQIPAIYNALMKPRYVLLEGKPWLDHRQQGLYTLYDKAVKEERPSESGKSMANPTAPDIQLNPAIAKVKVSGKAQKAHQMSISLFEPLKPGKAHKIAIALNDVSLRALQIKQFMDREKREISESKQSSAGFSDAFDSIRDKIQNLEGAVDGLELQLITAEADPKLKDSELVSRIREQVTRLKVQLKELEVTREGMVKTFPSEVQSAIKGQEDIARLTKSSWRDSDTERLQHLAESVARFKDLPVGDELAPSAAKTIIDQERAAATLMIQKAYGKMHREVAKSKDEDLETARIMRDFFNPKPLTEHPEKLVGYLSRGMMQLAVPEHLQPKGKKCTDAERGMIFSNLERARTLLGEVKWQKLLNSPSIAPFKANYEFMDQEKQAKSKKATDKKTPPPQLPPRSRPPSI